MNSDEKNPNEINGDQSLNSGEQNHSEPDEKPLQELEEQSVHIDKSKIDQALDSFIKEQEITKERERQRKINMEKKKRAKRWAKILSVLGIVLFVLVIILINPQTHKQYKKYVQAQKPKEEYTIEYIYSPGMAILPLGSDLVTYDSSNIRRLQKDGAEVFDIPFSLGSWDMATSKKRIYLLDKIEKQLYFIDEKGNFINKVALNNLPFKLYSGINGNLVVQYRSEAGVEGILIFDNSGKQLEDLTYPKTTLTLIDVNESNQVTVHGMYRIDPTLSNVVYRYSDRGKQIFSTSFKDVIFVRQYENGHSLGFVDINQLQFYSKVTNEPTAMVQSLIPAKIIEYDEEAGNIYILDKRNKLRVIDFEGQILEERYFQVEYEDMRIFGGNLLLFGSDFVRTPTKELKYPKKIEEIFELEDYLVVVMKGVIRMTNKME